MIRICYLQHMLEKLRNHGRYCDTSVISSVTVFALSVLNEGYDDPKSKLPELVNIKLNRNDRLVRRSSGAFSKCSACKPSSAHFPLLMQHQSPLQE